MWFVLSNSLLSWKDRTLLMRISRVEALLNSLPQQREDMLTPRLDELVGILPEGQLIQIIGANDDRLFPLDTPRSVPPFPKTTCTKAWIQNIDVAKESYRRLCHPITYQGKPAYLLVSTPLIEDQILLGNFTSGLYKMTPLLLLVSSIGGYSLSRRALRPVALLIAEARTITARDLSRRLPVPLVDDELRRLALEWNNLLARIQGAMDRVTQFTADASHELRNPLAYIRTTAEFNLRNLALDEESREGFQEIVDETKSTGELLENLLALARADAGYIPTEMDEVAVDIVIEDVCKRMEPLVSAKLQHLAWKSTDASEPTLTINLLHFRRLLTILLDNAIKYTPAGGNVAITYEWKSGLHLEVSDTGIGIAQQHLPKVFDRFYRVDSARTEANDGVGLGLPIAKWLVELYGGRIQIESELSRGTKVTVFFPRYKVANGNLRTT